MRNRRGSVSRRLGLVLSLGAIAALIIVGATAAHGTPGNGGGACHGDRCTPPTDVCPNIDGHQSEVPDGMVKNGHGDCVPVPPTDVCPNIDGHQSEIPDGMVKDEQGNCVTPPPVDVCPNIDGHQSEIPDGMIKDENGNCVPHNPPVDVCPNLPGHQSEIPDGMVKDEQGNCVTPPPVDVCPNLPGHQSEIPDGMIKDEQGNCVTPPPIDVCPNIDGHQPEIPDGMIKDEHGNCVTPPPIDVCPNIDGHQSEIPDGMIKDENGNCVPHGPQDLGIAKTAAGHYDLQHTWTIDKQVKLAGASDATYSDNAVLNLPDGGAGSVTWKVSVVESSYVTNLTVTGTITVSNPNDQDVTGVSVSDPGGVVDCSPAAGVQSSGLTVPANGSLACTYTATPGSMVPTNTATVSWGGNHQSASTTATIAWSKGADLGMPATVNDGGVIDNAVLYGSSTKTYDERWTCSHGTASPNKGRTNTATVTWDGGSDSDSASVQVGCGSTPPPTPPTPPTPPSDEHMDVQVAKAATAQVQLVNGQADIAYTVRVRNNGPNQAHNVVLKDAAPSGVTFLAVTLQPVSGSCTITPALLECTLGTLGPGVEQTIGFTARVAHAGTFENCAIATGEGGDTNAANNTACASTLVTAPVTPPVTPPTPKPKPKPKPHPKPQPELCRVLRVTPGMVKANGKRHLVTAKVTKSRNPVQGVAVRFKGTGLDKVVRTNRDGVAVVGVTPGKAGIMVVRITNVKACNSARIGVVGVFEPPVTG